MVCIMLLEGCRSLTGKPHSILQMPAARNRLHGRCPNQRQRPHFRLRPTVLQLSAATAEQQTAPQTEQQQAFEDLLLQQACSSAVALKPSPTCQGYGLFLTKDVKPGDVVLSVPSTACLIVDYQTGLELPQAPWPRLLKAVRRDNSTPWDILLALALLDSLAGAGGAFWERYANTLLPRPTQLTLPCCLPDPGLLPELQHEAIVAGARAQKARLKGLFPGLAAPMCEGGPSWLEWGFGCVRSRAFRLGPDAFAFVPFLDAANHSWEPSCDFRLLSEEGAVQLVALREARAGEEATISYTGPQGMTNQRLMAQYGFVLPHGNPADRLAFASLSGAADTPPPDTSLSRTAAAAAGAAGIAPAAVGASSSSSGSAPVLLSLDRLQECLGDGQTMAAAFSGRDPNLYAALKSLPLALDDSKASPVPEQQQLASALLAELERERSLWATSPAEDQALLSTLGEATGRDASAGFGATAFHSNSSSAQSADQAADRRLEAAIQYRLQRKLLVGAGTMLVRRFLGAT